MSHMKPPERIQKVLANHGLGSRRKIEAWVDEGRITVNGKIATLGDRLKLTDKVQFNGKTVVLNDEEQLSRRVIIYNKPEGEICTRHDPEGRETIFKKLPPLKKSRWVTVGRLDINSMGMILLTNDGELAHRLMHPSYQIEREYAVRVLGNVEPEALDRLKNGVELSDGIAKFNTIEDAGGEGANHWYHVTLNEGKNREVRRMWESVGVTVSRLIRVRFGPIQLHRSIRPGKCEELSSAQIDRLLTLVKMKSKPKSAPKKGRARVRDRKN